MTETCDVAVVGAGLAGLETARLLSSSGIDVVLIDRKANLFEKIHTTGIFVRRTLEDFDLPEADLGPPIRHVVLASPSGKELELTSQQDEFRVGKMGQLYTSLLEEAVGAGARWWPKTTFAGLESADQGTNLKLRRGTETLHLHARYVVAADGALSKVASALGLDENEKWIVGSEAVLASELGAEQPHFRLTMNAKLAPGYLAWVVDDGHEQHVGVAGAGKNYRPAEELRRYSDQLGMSPNVSVIERRGGRIPVGGVLRKIASRQGLAVGDAAGAVSPLTAGGLDPALRLSRLAADVIIGMLQHNEPDAFLRYNGERFRRRFSSRLLLRRLLELGRSNTLINLGMWALRTPPGRKFAAKLFFGRGSFPDVELNYLPQPGKPS
jgi:flavin-dependent dehydrogenase